MATPKEYTREQRIKKLEAENERLQQLCRDLTGEETLHQDGTYKTEMMRLREVISEARDAATAAPELNMANYTEGDVAMLNDAMMDIYGILSVLARDPKASEKQPPTYGNPGHDDDDWRQ